MTPQELLKSKSLKVTPARLALLNVLRSVQSPLTVEELHKRISKKSDLVTMYRALERFLLSGLVREVRLKDGSLRYEFAEEHHHHHLVCTSCGIIDELPVCEATKLENHVLRQSARFTIITEHALEFYGICRSCARAV